MVVTNSHTTGCHHDYQWFWLYHYMTNVQIRYTILFLVYQMPGYPWVILVNWFRESIAWGRFQRNGRTPLLSMQLSKPGPCFLFVRMATGGEMDPWCAKHCAAAAVWWSMDPSGGPINDNPSWKIVNVWCTSTPLAIQTDKLDQTGKLFPVPISCSQYM